MFQPDENTLLLTALDGSENPSFCYTVRELKMLAMINELTDMPDWDRKVFDSDFTFKWKSAKLLTGDDVTRSMAEWCIEEVKCYVHSFIPSRIIHALDGGVIKSDDSVEISLKDDISNGAARLRNIAVKTEDSENSVLDIVDPYLYPFAFQKTRTLHFDTLTTSECVSRSGEGEPVKKPSSDECVQQEHNKYPNDVAWSNRFQWLPFDVVFENRGAGASSIASYINNVHPIAHRSFYNTIEKLVDALLPLFNRILIDLKAPGYQNQRFHLAESGRDPVIQTEPGPFRPPEQRAIVDWLDKQGRYQDFLFVELKKELWNIGIQMVLHIQDINLTPQTPQYEGEEWHIQGQMNERVCATAHYIYSHQNTTLPTISFRRRINPEEAGLATACITSPPFATELYGVGGNDPPIQKVGDVSLREGRVIMFPNTFQTKLNTFSLADSSRLGHLRLLTLHLIDPNRRTMSTAMVPCQRRDWWAREVRITCPRFWRLPMEVWDTIVGLVDGWPLGAAEAQEMRTEFKEERERFRKQHTESMETYLPYGWDIGSDEDEWVHL